MRRLRQPVQIANARLRLAIRQVFARPLLTGSMLLVLAPAGQSLTLGDISVRSTLGQRLDATVPVRLGAGEALASGCVLPGHQAADLRTVPGAEVTTPQAAREGLYELQVTSAAALYEPMYALELKVQCPGSPGLIRQYVLMLDLPAAVASRAAAAYEPAVESAPATTVRPTTAQRRSTPSRPGATIEAGVRYRVTDGDTLSSIAARVRSRTVSLWTLAGAIQAANPEAFIRNDANLIKLGSEILIPATTATSSPVVAASTAAEPVPVSAPAPTPVAPPVLATEPAEPAEPVLPVQPALVPQAEAAEAPRPAATPASIPRRTAVPKPAAAPLAEVNEPNPVIAASAGILFGLCISALLWARGRLPSRKRAAAKPAPDRQAPSPFATTALATAITTTPAPLLTRSLEPAFSVSYTPPADDSIAREFTGEHVTAELEELFDSTDTTIQKRLNAEKTIAARSLGTDLQDDDAPALAKPGSGVDFLVGDPADEDATSQSGTVDIHALAASATKDQQQAQTLLEALTLLERDYEEELTASQVLDMSAVREALGSDFDEPTEIRDTQIRAASARKRAR
jgi:Tfp pilus assembly protein FimV